MAKLEQEWELVEKGITKLKNILEGSSSDSSFDSETYMTLYTTIYNLLNKKPPCAAKPAEIYERYCMIIKEYITSTVLPSLVSKHGEFLLRELCHRWDNYKLMVRWLSRCFCYLERFHIPKNKLPSLNEAGITSFRILINQELNGLIRETVISIIEEEREGCKIDRSLLKNVLGIFVAIGMDTYQQDFEAHMIEYTGSYYSRKASMWILEDSSPDYMRKAEQCLNKEKDRVRHYLHSNTEPKLLERVQHELLVVYQIQLLEKEASGCRVLLDANKHKDLSRMFQLYHNIPQGLEPVAAIFGQHITDEGNALLQQAEEAAAANQAGSGGAKGQALVGKIIELLDRCMDYVTNTFQNHALFHKALKEAFEAFCNKNVAGTSSAELLAAFCDNMLKKPGSEKLSDEDFEETLGKVVKLLAYVHEKDLFAEFQHKKLGRRLLFDRSSNEDQERSLLSKLKQQCGAQFTSKMEGMVTDLTLAREHQNSFQEYLADCPASHPGIDFSVTVITTGFWPTYKSFDIHLPAEMVKCVQTFNGYYEKRTQNRKLNWIFSLGSCQVLGKFNQKPIELIVSTYQTAVLLLFNSYDRLSFPEIAAHLNLSAEDLVRLLHSLSWGKYKILIKEPDTKTISLSDCFKFNAKFTDRMRRIRVPLPLADERKKVIEDVDKDRRYAIDAAIVRIMKGRKVLALQQLVSECVNQLSRMFKADIKAIKKRTEDLIMREFLERDKENPALLRYLA